MRRLLALIEERLQLRLANQGQPPEDGPRVLAEQGVVATSPLDLPATITGDMLSDFTAPLFNRHRGGRLVRGAKAVLNFPLRIFGKPQASFNDGLRATLLAWSELLRALIDGHAVLQHELAEQRRRLDELAARLDELHRLLERPADASSRLP